MQDGEGTSQDRTAKLPGIVWNEKGEPEIAG